MMFYLYHILKHMYVMHVIFLYNMYVILYAMYVILYVMYVCSGRLACFYLILFLVKRIEHFNHLDMRYINALYYYYYITWTIYDKREEM